MKAVLIDDEQSAIELLEIQLNKLAGIEVVGKYTNATSAFIAMQELEVDVVFLDIEMAEVNGLQFGEKLMMKYPHIQVIFVTAHSQYAVEAFELNAIDYLLKPVQVERLKKTVNKLEKNLKLYGEIRHSVKVSAEPITAQLMGSFCLYNMGKEEVRWRTKKGKELFAYLWHHQGKENDRTHITEALWGDLPHGKAVTLLHTTMYQLRRKLKEIGIEQSVHLINENYILNIPIQSDYEELEELVHSSELTHVSMRKMIELYKGDYLGEEDYHWAVPRQQKFKQSFLHYLEQYVEKMKQEQVQSYHLEICLDKMTQLDPYNERYAYLLIEHYGKVRKVKQMAEFFEHFKSEWVEELGLDVPKPVVDIYVKYITR